MKIKLVTHDNSALVDVLTLPPSEIKSMVTYISEPAYLIIAVVLLAARH
jgi:hypothetical protein